MISAHTANVADQSEQALARPLVRSASGIVFERKRLALMQERASATHQQARAPQKGPAAPIDLAVSSPARALPSNPASSTLPAKPSVAPSAADSDKSGFRKTPINAPTELYDVLDDDESDGSAGTDDRSTLRRLDGSRDYSQFREEGRFGSHPSYDDCDDESAP